MKKHLVPTPSPTLDAAPDQTSPAGINLQNILGNQEILQRIECNDGGSSVERVPIPGQGILSTSLGGAMSNAVGLSGPAIESLLQEQGAMAASVGQAILLSRQATPREAAHESIHFMQNEGGAAASGVSQPHDRSEGEAEMLVDRVLQGRPTQVQQASGAALQRQERPAQPSIADQIRARVNYTATDLRVGPDDEVEVIRLLSGASGLAGVINDLNGDGTLSRMISRVDTTTNRHELLQLLGRQLTGAELQRVEQLVVPLGQEWVTQLHLANNGVTDGAPSFDASNYAHLITSNASDPFTGVGATGTNPTELSISLLDQGLLAADHDGTVNEYSNPLVPALGRDLGTYLQGLTPQQRSEQAQLLCNQPISTIQPESYGGEIPSRAQVMRGAAATHNLHPELIAAIILAEQRDQSQKEDAKDYLAANSIMEGNTSIGLGQVVVSTAQNNDLFSDLLDTQSRQNLSHGDTARLLASDEYNIFAVAKYIRKVADDGSQISISSLPNTLSEYPNIDMAAYANNSRTWPDDNIHALGSEYTSRAWDDHLSTGWGWFVHEAYLDVLASGVF